MPSLFDSRKADMPYSTPKLITSPAPLCSAVARFRDVEHSTRWRDECRAALETDQRLVAGDVASTRNSTCE